MKLFEAYSNIQAVRSNSHSSDADLKIAYEEFMRRLLIEGKEGVLHVYKNNDKFKDTYKAISSYEFESANPEDIIMMCYLLFHH